MVWSFKGVKTTTLNRDTQQGAGRTNRSASFGSRKFGSQNLREQTPSTGDYRRAYRGRTETTKGNIKGGGNKRRTRAYRSRETYTKA